MLLWDLEDTVLLRWERWDTSNVDLTSSLVAAACHMVILPVLAPDRSHSGLVPTWFRAGGRGTAQIEIAQLYCPFLAPKLRQAKR